MAEKRLMTQPKTEQGRKRMVTYEWVLMVRGKCAEVDHVPLGAVIEYIDDHECAGRCEVCGEPIKECTDYDSDEDGVLVCVSCKEKSGMPSNKVRCNCLTAK